MLVEELKELARSIQEQRAEEQKIEVKAAHIDCRRDCMIHYQVFQIKIQVEF